MKHKMAEYDKGTAAGDGDTTLTLASALRKIDGLAFLGFRGSG